MRPRAGARRDRSRSHRATAIARDRGTVSEARWPPLAMITEISEEAKQMPDIWPSSGPVRTDGSSGEPPSDGDHQPAAHEARRSVYSAS